MTQVCIFKCHFLIQFYHMLMTYKLQYVIFYIFLVKFHVYCWVLNFITAFIYQKRPHVLCMLLVIFSMKPYLGIQFDLGLRHLFPSPFVNPQNIYFLQSVVLNVYLSIITKRGTSSTAEITDLWDRGALMNIQYYILKM